MVRISLVQTNCQDKGCTAEVPRNVFLDTQCKSFDFVTAPRINTDFPPLFVLVGPKRFNRFLPFFPLGTSAFHKLLLFWHLLPCQSWQNINIFMLNGFFFVQMLLELWTWNHGLREIKSPFHDFLLATDHDDRHDNHDHADCHLHHHK